MLVCVRVGDVLIEKLLVSSREASKVRYSKKRQSAYRDRVEVKGKKEKARGWDSDQNWGKESNVPIASSARFLVSVKPYRPAITFKLESE